MVIADAQTAFVIEFPSCARSLERRLTQWEVVGLVATHVHMRCHDAALSRLPSINVDNIMPPPPPPLPPPPLLLLLLLLLLLSNSVVTFVQVQIGYTKMLELGVVELLLKKQALSPSFLISSSTTFPTG